MSRTATALGIALSLATCLLASAAASAADITELTIPEQVGAARTNEPIRMGVPLAKGVAKDVGELGLLDAAGKPIPCQFVEAMRWPDDKSLRWVHVIFQASVPAKGTATVKLVKGVPVSAAGANPNAVVVTEGKDGVTVSNGVLKLAIKAAKFNLFDGAWFDPTGKFGPGTEIVKPGGEGIVAMIDGKPHKPGNDSMLAVEEKGTEAAVIKVSGQLVTGPDGPFDYVCRIHVFAGSPVVKVDFSYTDSHVDPGAKTQQAWAASKVSLSDLSVVLPVAGDDLKATVGGEGKNYSGKAAVIVAKTSDSSEITVDGAAAGTAKGKTTKPLTIGWADLSGGDKGLAVGVRWFWQMFPKAMDAGDGKLRAGLFAKEVGTPLDVYMGQGRTHYLTFLFHGKTDDAALSNFFVGTQMPLRALATPKYYCRDAQGFGNVADADPSLYPADILPLEKKYDEMLKTSLDKITKKIESFSDGGVTLDSYGYYAWGDLFHHHNDGPLDDPWYNEWESNYYDFPWNCGLQFARTGNLAYLDIMDRNGLNLADVFMCKWTPEKQYCGTCRYSPPENFVGNGEKPYFSVEFNHAKAQSILARYFLLGNLRAKDDFLLALNNAMLAPAAHWTQCRGPGARLATLYGGYLLTGDPAVLDKMKAAVADGRKAGPPTIVNVKNPQQSFMVGVATEGLCYYWWLTGDKGTLDLVTAIDDIMVDKAAAAKSPTQPTSNNTFSFSLLYRQTGDEKYKKAAMDLFKIDVPEARPKNFAMHWRNCAYAWYYLSNLGEKKDTPLAPAGR